MNIPTYLTGATQARAYHLLRSYVYSALEKYKITPTHWSILGIIKEAEDGLRSSEIATKMHVKAPLVTLITHELILRNYVVSSPHQSDGRARVLSISPEGKEFMDKIEKDLRKRLERLLKGLSDDDLTVYYKVLQTMIVNGEQI
jgi:DNA-binding MarR family transcriptional regulator